MRDWYKLPSPLSPPNDFDLAPLPSSNIDEDDDRPLPPPLQPQPLLFFQPPQQLTVLTSREIKQMAAQARAEEQVFEKKS